MVIGLLARLVPLGLRTAPKVLSAIKPLFIGKSFLGTTARTLSTLTGVGIFAESPIIRKAVIGRVKDPLSFGRKIGRGVETGFQVLETEKKIRRVPQSLVPNITLRSGLTATALPSGELVRSERLPIIPKIKEKVKDLAPSIIIPGLAAGIGALTTALLLREKDTKLVPLLPIPSQIQPIGVAKKIVEEEKPKVPTPTMPSITNKINVSPEININFRKSRKFINQQILVRQ